METSKIDDLQETIGVFNFPGSLIDIKINKQGHINDTYVLSFLNEEKIQKYIFQRVNQGVFKRPEELMENIIGVTKHLRKKVQEAKGDLDREVLQVLLTKDQKPFYIDAKGDFWRAYKFIENSLALEKASGAKDLYQTGLAFGNFQRLLSDYPAESLHQSIKDFHNTEVRLENFIKALEENPAKRRDNVLKEADFILSRADFCKTFMDLERKKLVPLRVTHNDTKLNNILLDDQSHKALCVIDLDTIMPGLSMNDFGDGIRSGASNALEDEADLEKVFVNLEYFEAFSKGFLQGAGPCLEDLEVYHLRTGAKMMTLECGIRFLTDYLQGDQYFKISYPDHNLVRARNQFKLVADMEKNWEVLLDIVNKYKE
ncbi:phosphotransferase enzyme family protein [Neofamilia massiliensis]|uniref:phosphotransferase enzyme family protein n=1 Tax=Neofamilia massiliensis TaxID=1673724 RepID=UPI0006BB75D7|nr:phosphotransferase [Neofamilia massiliensis]